MNCPKCGKEMEPGYAKVKELSIHLHPLGTIQWLYWKGDTSNKDERLFPMDIGGTTDIFKVEAYRCPDCKIVALSYENGH